MPLAVLDDMSFGVELLMCNNIHAARRMASELDGLNQTRKEIEEGMKQEAMAFCERLQFGENSELPYGLSLFQRDWHQGVIGILLRVSKINSIVQSLPLLTVVKGRSRVPVVRFLDYTCVMRWTSSIRKIQV